MSAADIVILVLLILPAITGIFYGFLNIIFSLLSWALATGLALKLTPLFTPLLAAQVDSPVLRAILVFLGLFILGLMLLSGISYLIVKLLGRSGLTAADRLLGMLLGLGLGGAIVTVIVFLAGFTALPQQALWQESRLIRPFQQIGDWGAQFLPDSFRPYHAYDMPAQRSAG